MTLSDSDGANIGNSIGITFSFLANRLTKTAFIISYSITGPSVSLFLSQQKKTGPTVEEPQNAV